MKKLLLISISLVIIAGCGADPVDMQANVLQQGDCGSLISIAENGQTNEGFIILDVRTESEYMEKHIPNSINIDINEIAFPTEIEKLDKAKKYLVYCKSGNRSGRSISIMKERGFANVCNLEGGITKWEAEGKPVLTSDYTSA